MNILRRKLIKSARKNLPEGKRGSVRDETVAGRLQTVTSRPIGRISPGKKVWVKRNESAELALKRLLRNGPR
jgi:hypothetical protein